MMPADNAPGVRIEVNGQDQYHYYHGWWGNRLDDGKLGSMSEHAKELLEEHDIEWRSFAVYPVRYDNGQHTVTGEADCGAVKSTDWERKEQ